MKMKRSNQVFLLCASLGMAIVALALWQTGLLSKLLGDKKATETPQLVWSLALDEVDRLWRGDINLDSPILKENCPEFFLEDDQIPQELKSCREEIFRCVVENQKAKVKLRSDYYLYEIKMTSGKSISLKINKEIKNFELKRNCHEVELPQGLYWGNAQKDKAKRVWATNGVRYFIDRLLVRNIDLRDVVKAGKLKELKKKVDNIKEGELYQPAGFLLPKQMEEYCRFHGKQILSSRVRAALTFHHGRKKHEDIKDQAPDWNTSPYPFGMRKEESPSYLVKHGTPFKKEFCHKLRTKECLDFNPFVSFPGGLGWSGVAELLGGLPEYVRGEEYPRRNIHPSSIYYSLKDDVHEAGKRIFWNGRGHRRIDFNFATTKPFEADKDHYEVGFRCMRMEFSK